MLTRQCHQYLIKGLGCRGVATANIARTITGSRTRTISPNNHCDIGQICPNYFVITRCCSNTAATSSGGGNNVEKNKIDITFDHGLPLLTIPLPSRKDKCQFLLKPVAENVQIFCDNLSKEDKGIDYVAVHNREGVRIAGSTSIEHLLQLKSFTIRINDDYFPVEVPPILPSSETSFGHQILESSERLTTLDDIKLKIAALHSLLQVDEYKLQREQILMKKLEEVESQLKPMEDVKQLIEAECDQRSTQIAWAGFIFMGVQTGILFRLTYFEYSWDVVEPLSYFLNYSTVVATLGYYLMTKQTFEYPNACERVFSKQFYRLAAKRKFDIPLFNELTKLREALIHDLHRLRDPLYQHLPATRLAALESDLAKKHLTGVTKYDPPSNVRMS